MSRNVELDRRFAEDSEDVDAELVGLKLKQLKSKLKVQIRLEVRIPGR